MIDIVVVYHGEDACTQCLGWKRVAEESGDSWKYWAELTPPSNIAVQMGLVKPVECPHCHGTGIEPKENLK